YRCWQEFDGLTSRKEFRESVPKRAAPPFLDYDKRLYLDAYGAKIVHSPLPSSSRALEILRCRCLEPMGTDFLAFSPLVASLAQARPPHPEIHRRCYVRFETRPLKLVGWRRPVVAEPWRAQNRDKVRYL